MTDENTTIVKTCTWMQTDNAPGFYRYELGCYGNKAHYSNNTIEIFTFCPYCGSRLNIRHLKERT